MDRQSIESSMIASAGYDPADRMLEIQFISGSIYRYFAVPQEVYTSLLAAESAGRYFDSAIRDEYTYERVS